MFKQIAAAAALAFVASTSFAAPTAFYGGLDVGSTKIDHIDDSKTSFGGFVGYGFNQYIALEVGYRQLGEWHDAKVQQTHVSVVGTYPLNRQLDIYGRAGTNHLRGDYPFGDATGGLYGIGLNYSFAPNISGRLEVQKPASDVTNVGVGVVFKF
jgi:predicted porin